MTFFEKLNTAAQDVVLYNTVQNKVSPFSDEDVLNQASRVEEEVNELESHITQLKSDGVMTFENAVAIMDDVCDIAVTLSYLVHMQGESPVPYHREVKNESADAILGHITSCRHDALGMGKFTAICEFLSTYPEVIGCKKFDILGGFNAVNQNNLSKFIALDDENESGAIEDHSEFVEKVYHDTIAKYPNEEIFVVRNLGYMAFQRKSDNKNMKPSTFVDVDLKPFVEIL